HGEDVARNIESNAQLSTIFASTLSPQLRALRDFDVIFLALKSKAIDLNRLADMVNQGAPVYASPRAHRLLDEALKAVTPFAQNLADLLIYQKGDWDRMMNAGEIPMRFPPLRTLLKVLAFVLLSVVFTIGLAIKIGNLQLFAHNNSYSAMFTDAAVVFKGDDVKLAGVNVGRVTGTHIESGHP